jgi:hypothetical protein
VVCEDGGRKKTAARQQQGKEELVISGMKISVKRLRFSVDI